MVAIAIIALAAGLCVTLAERNRIARYEARLVNNLQLISLAFCGLTNEAHRELPPPVISDGNGEPMYSWRVKLVPFFEVSGWIVEPGKAWNAPENRSLTALIDAPYCIPATHPKRPKDTNVFAISGPGTALDPSNTVRPSDFDCDLILVMEVANSGTHWMEPGDYELAELLKCSGELHDCVPPIFRDRIHILFADGEIWSLSGHTPVERVKPFFTINGAKSHSREEELGEYRVNKWTSPGMRKRCDAD